MNIKKEIQFYAVLIKILDYSLLLSYHLIWLGLMYTLTTFIV